MTDTKAQKEQILSQAKKIMDDFMLSLDKVKGIEEEFGAEVKDDKRKPSADGGKIPNYSEIRGEFRKRMFKNAPKVKDDFIQAEKKSW